MPIEDQKMSNENNKNVFFIHCKCCEEHWNLLYFALAKKRCELQCKKCGELVGGSIKDTESLVVMN